MVARRETRLELAPAKVNLALEVLGRRDDGYHEVRTVLQTISLADEVRVTHSEQKIGSPNKIQLRVTPKGSAPVQGNLALAAADDRTLMLPPGDVQITLSKHIPMAAGLGGGSSDAAATLRALTSITVDAFSYTRTYADWMHRAYSVARKIGSDAPFFIEGGTAQGRGRGDELWPLPSPVDRWVVVVVPNEPEVENKTGRMYQLLRPEHYSDGAATVEVIRRLFAEVSLDGALHNVFDAVAAEAYRGYAAMRERFLEAGARQPTLCGAGPAMFALAHDEVEGESMRACLETAGYRAYLEEFWERESLEEF